MIGKIFTFIIGVLVGTFFGQVILDWGIGFVVERWLG